MCVCVRVCMYVCVCVCVQISVMECTDQCYECVNGFNSLRLLLSCACSSCPPHVHRILRLG